MSTVKEELQKHGYIAQLRGILRISAQGTLKVNNKAEPNLNREVKKGDIITIGKGVKIEV